MARGLFRHPPQPLQRKGTPELLVPPPATPCYHDAVIASGATAYWRWGEPSGTTAADEIGNATPGTYVNTPTLGTASLLPGDSNTAITLLASSNQHVSVAQTSAIAVGNAGFSFELIFTPTSVMLDGTTRYLMMKGNAGNSSPNIAINGADKNIEWRSDGWGDGTKSGSAIVAGTKYHVIATHSASHVWKLYVNGVDVTTGVGSAQCADDGNPLLVGKVSTDATHNADAVVDEYAVYKGIVLTAADAATHYAAMSVACAGGSTVNVTADDSIATTDSVTRTVTNLRTTSDSVSVANTVVRVATNLRTAADSIGLADSVARVVTNLRTAADSLGISESVAGLKVVPRTLADAIAISDAVTRTGTFLRTAADSVGLSDAVTRTATLLRTAADSISIGNTVARVVTNLRTAADSIGIADSVARTLTNLRTAADSISVGNTVARVVTNLRTAADSVSIAESVNGIKVILRTLADSITVTDSVSRTVTNIRTLADSISVGNSVSRTVTSVRTATDNLSIGDVVARVATLIRTAADSVNVAESVDGQVTHGGGTLVQVTASDSITITDSVSRTVINIRSVDDNVIFVDVVTSTGGQAPPPGGHPGRGGNRVVRPVIVPGEDEGIDDDEDFLLGVI